MNPELKAESGQTGILHSTYSYLMAHSTGLRNANTFACMLASYSIGQGAMPRWLGLDEGEYIKLMKLYYPGAVLLPLENTMSGQLLERSDEQSELHELLLLNKADLERDILWMANIVTIGCMGSNHLWQDLGLWERKELTDLMNLNFPSLAGRNDKNMKWKKFLYKQLCEQEGIYTCRSPSCEVCADYNECFSPE